MEFLLAPNVGTRLVYIYRGGRLRRAMLDALELSAKAQDRQMFRHSPEGFGAALGGLLHGFHWADLGDVKSLLAEAAMEAMLAYNDGPTAVFVSASSASLRSDIWLQLRMVATIVEEPLPRADTLDAVLSFGLRVSDLSPAADLFSDPKFRSYFLDRLHLYGGINEILLDIDDYILTCHDRPALGHVQPRVPEFALGKVLKSFLENGGRREERSLLEQAFLRGDDEKLVLGALTSSTISLLGQNRRRNEPRLNRKGEALLLWGCTLLASHLSAAVLMGGYAPSWRGRPDCRQFLVSQLCRDFRRAEADASFRDWLIQQAGEALARAPLLSRSDEHAARRLGKFISAFLNALESSPAWCTDLARLLGGTGDVGRELILNFDVSLEAIRGQLLVAEHLKRRVAQGALNTPVLLYGRKSDDRDRTAAALTKALLCETPIEGDACDKCESCRALINGGSASYAIARLETETHPQHAERQVGWAAERQLQEVRRLVLGRSLWPGRRVVILDGVDKVRKQALDRLLKTIEEAPPLISFIFLAERPARVPAALRSRSLSMAIKSRRQEVAFERRKLIL